MCMHTASHPVLSLQCLSLELALPETNTRRNDLGTRVENTSNVVDMSVETASTVALNPPPISVSRYTVP